VQSALQGYPDRHPDTDRHAVSPRHGREISWPRNGRSRDRQKGDQLAAYKEVTVAMDKADPRLGGLPLGPLVRDFGVLAIIASLLLQAQPERKRDETTAHPGS